MQASVVSRPYPYVVVDGFLGRDILRDIRRNWPGLGYFVGEIPGNYVCPLKWMRGEGFWKEFTDAIVPQLARMGLVAFAPEIEVKYPGEKNFYICNYSLMQARADYGGHDVHNHHYHDPTWVATALVYLDADSTGHSGTTVMRARDALDEAEVAAQTLNWHDLTEEALTVDYAPGRLFAFHDNPIAYHSVKRSRPPALFGRRILRVHLQASPGHCERLYGVNYHDYQSMRETPAKTTEVIGWMEKDISLLRSGQKMSREEHLSWIMEKIVAFETPAWNG